MDDFEIKDGVLIKYHGRSQEVVVPQGTVAIGGCAFKDNNSINLIEFPQSLINIGEEAFSNCESLEKITLSKAIKFIGFAAFANTKIKDIYYEGTIEEFGAIKTRDPIFGIMYPFSDSSSSSSTIFGMYTPVLHCKDVEDSLYYLLAELQGLIGEND